jgi:phage tail sheath protein FI
MGARTLAGNDNEWRYIPVRRFFSMVEESVKNATEQFVFEPNDRNTWVRVKSMIENYLTQQWKIGALMALQPRKPSLYTLGWVKQ